ncbi:MAG: sugar transferase [Candidatus Omnitrophica bacterium]|nr:sugar transferase [Candidatus Omnitrophota bacterium]
MIKRIFDFLLSLSGIVISLPLWGLISFLIILENGLPVFYFQERSGKNKTTFKAIKFRSMVKDAEKNTGAIQAKEDDERITFVGRILRSTAMDELPQLINILRGEMSFVGPRALRPSEKETQGETVKNIYEYPGFEERSKVIPGLTGIAQIFAPRDISREEKFKFDIFYVRNKSFFLDIYLIFLSFLITFKGKWETREDKFCFFGEGLKEKVSRGVSKIVL